MRTNSAFTVLLAFREFLTFHCLLFPSVTLSQLAEPPTLPKVLYFHLKRAGPEAKVPAAHRPSAAAAAEK